jgi:hypothetical protein
MNWTPWPGPAKELYLPSDRRFSVKLVPTLKVEGGQRDGSLPEVLLAHSLVVIFSSSNWNLQTEPFSWATLISYQCSPRPASLNTGLSALEILISKEDSDSTATWRPTS